MTKRHRPLSHSAREQYKNCPKAFAYGRELRLEPKEKKSSLRMGTGFSLALEHRDPDRVADGYFEGVPLEQQVMDYAASLEIAQAKLLAELYLDRHPDHERGIWTPEVEFRDPVAGHGFLDGVIELPTGERVGVENKLLTKGMYWNDTARKVLAIDDQVTAYFYAMREAGTPLDWLEYRVTFKPSIKPDSRKVNKDTGRKGETTSEYIARLRARIAAEPEYAFDKLPPLYRTDEQLDRFAEEAAEVNEHVKLSRKRGAWPKNTKACTMFGGCAFLPICRDEVGAADLYRVREERVEPKLPRLGKVQKAVLLALGDSFTASVTTASLHKQVPHATASVTTALNALNARELAAYTIGPEPDYTTTWEPTEAGRQAIELLCARAASDAAASVKPSTPNKD